jgi:phosphoribosyl 1,2-cyclic phosphodiesterase
VYLCHSAADAWNPAIFLTPGTGRVPRLLKLGPVDEGLINQHVKNADQILIGHGHWDHMADVPYIAKKTNAMVIGSERRTPTSCGPQESPKGRSFR